MKKIKSLAIAIPVVAASVLMFAGTAQAEGIPVESECLTGWYVNNDGDENTRQPTSTEEGLVFKDSQLVHHAPEQNITLNNLHPGTYDATPTPSLSSFFSVEIANPDGSAYATLRYDADEQKWYIGGPRGETYASHETNPIEFIGKKDNWGTIAQDAHVLSFGVGYTSEGGTETTVKSVTFAGKTYDLTCEPEPEPTAEPTAEPSVEPSETPSSSAPPVSTGGNLPITGMNIAAMGTAGAGFIGVGLVALLWGMHRRRETE